MSGTSHHTRSRTWLLTKISEHPYLAISSASVRPKCMIGEHCSAILHTGVRTWAFKNAKERDAFIDAYPPTARAVQSI